MIRTTLPLVSFSSVRFSLHGGSPPRSLVRHATTTATMAIASTIANRVFLFTRRIASSVSPLLARAGVAKQLAPSPDVP
ncbi:hypothetical protein [Sphingomonas sp. S2-65]|uniref:hypothetical protein n=1 Tax=Sphingomonas sp. S2-65 TaxID=2903960 RepID=UPI001F25478C|nr:hypothetical protein [Sphingomonas sp. S2-65]UYY58973.1 hypothetical protein LZ586_02380 [Sphingomonas sp. S2-65]